ncbi:ankyrin repeat-containing protein [Stemphylium lycopersici]|uniref:Ankyrin repeat-containing protein n=1 Tax=Stemphylium lycopersici TaxID=183478 RepID=A0A364MUD5_STELY|nr:ankyrin repeat-containing protein [Stemphylium lycopersici]
MERRVSLSEIIRSSGIMPVEQRQAILPAPTQPAIIASEEDHAQARNILLERRAKNPESKNVLKSIFKSSKEKEKAQDAAQFSQEELDQALSAVIRGATTGPGLIQAFLSLGAKVNVIETQDKKKRSNSQANTSLRRRSTVLQQAASLRKADGVNILASSGADQTTLDEALKAALAANDQACISELLRHGADLNNFPTSLANAVRSNDLNLVRLLLRAPKPLRPDIISSCLPAAVQQTSDAIISLLIAYGADPNFDSASAFNMAIGRQLYKPAVALVAGPIRLTPSNLQHSLDTTMRLPTRQATLHFLRLLFCCGLPPDSRGMPDFLICLVRSNDTAGAKMLISYGVSTATNASECLREALANSNWTLVDAILQTPIAPQHAAAALSALPPNISQSDRLRVVGALIQKGVRGPPLRALLTRATKERDVQMIDLLLGAEAPVDAGENGALQAAVVNKDIRSLRSLLGAHPTPESLASLFPLLQDGLSPSERREFSRLLLENGARGPGVDQALIDAIADTSSGRDGALITDLVRNGANVDYDGGRVFSLAVAQVDMSLLRLLCNARPKSSSTSASLPIAFDSKAGRHAKTPEIIDLLLSQGVEEEPASRALQIAITGGPDNIDIIERLLTAAPGLLSTAFKYATAIEDPQKKAPILDALLKLGVPQESLDQALAAETRHAVSTKDTTSTKLLLVQGASVSYNDGEALSVAVASGDSSLTALLLSGKHPASSSSLTKAFRTLFTDDSISKNESSIRDLTQELLSRGVDQLAIDAGLRVLLSNEHDTKNTESLVDLLLAHNADVNTADGACFIFAAQKHSHAIFEKLMQHTPRFSVIVPALLSCKLADEVVVSAIQSCFDHGCSTETLLLHGVGYNKTPILISAMNVYPRNAALVTLLLDHGVDADAAASVVLHPSAGPETVPALHWALAQPQKRISDAVISGLLDAGGSVSHISPGSETAALMLAAREGRHGIVGLLLERGADIDARDLWNKSALFYASGSLSGEGVVKALAPHASSNDGSIHEAARELSVEAVKTLIEHGHDVNYPSRLHGGRNSLGELCLKATISSPIHRSRLRQVLRLLLSHAANPSFRARNEKSCVLLALDNAYSALPITESLLETDIWKDINDTAHIYHDTSSNLHYSPYSYVDLLSTPSRAQIRTALLDLLRDKACKPVYYSSSALQPVGATGLPPSIAQLVDLQKTHDLTLRHEKEKFEELRSMQETSHKDILRRKTETLDAELALQTKATSTHTALEQQKHDFEVQRLREAERVRRAEKANWHALLMEQERDAAARRQSVEERKVRDAVSVETKLIEARKAEVEHRANVERRMLKEKEEFYERNVKRQREVRQIEGSGGPQWGTVD